MFLTRQIEHGKQKRSNRPVEEIKTERTTCAERHIHIKKKGVLGEKNIKTKIEIDRSVVVGYTQNLIFCSFFVT